MCIEATRLCYARAGVYLHVCAHLYSVYTCIYSHPSKGLLLLASSTLPGSRHTLPVAPVALVYICIFVYIYARTFLFIFKVCCYSPLPHWHRCIFAFSCTYISYTYVCICFEQCTAARLYYDGARVCLFFCLCVCIIYVRARLYMYLEESAPAHLFHAGTCVYVHICMYVYIICLYTFICFHLKVYYFTPRLRWHRCTFMYTYIRMYHIFVYTYASYFCIHLYICI